MDGVRVLETCVDSVDAAVDVLRRNHASTEELRYRVELCSELEKEGLSPSISMLEEIVKEFRALTPNDDNDLSLRVMIRPPSSSIDEQQVFSSPKGHTHFIYSVQEMQWMKEAIYEFAKWNASSNVPKVQPNSSIEGFVFGCLKQIDTEHSGKEILMIDKDNLMQLLSVVVEASIEFHFEYHVTFHKAFDMVVNSIEALAMLLEINESLKSRFGISYNVIDYILTSGAENARDLSSKVYTDSSKHFHNINELTDRGRGLITIMPGGGVRSENASHVLKQCPHIIALHSSKLIQPEHQ